MRIEIRYFFLKSIRPYFKSSLGKWGVPEKLSAADRLKGFSLVEVLVAAAVLGIATVSVVVMIRKGGDLQVTNTYRLQARAFLNARMETLYQPGRFEFIGEGDISELVTFGFHQGGAALNGILYTSVQDSNVIGFPIKRIGLSLAWDVFDAGRDSIYIEKWLTE